jgi:putative peptidoglycan lipid II flippase
MFTPQIALYLIAGTGTAVMNAHGRFAFAAAAPAVENIGIIATIVASVALFGTGATILTISTPHLLLLGLGTTGAVCLHATWQWLGARSSGLTMTVSRGWRDPEVRAILRRVVPTLAYTGLAACQVFALLVFANRVAGGVVAIQLALNFFYLPLAVVAWPVARALLPHLSRIPGDGERHLFSAELSRGMALASFIVIPISVAYITLAFPLARAVAFGKLGTGHGERLLALSLATLGAGILAETWFILGTYAFYARKDARSPLRAMAVRVGVSACLMLATWTVHGDAVMPFLGLSLAAGSLAGAWYMGRALRTELGTVSRPAGRSLAAMLAAAVAMAVPAFFTAQGLRLLVPGKLGALIAMSAATAIGLATYAGLHAALRSPELLRVKDSVVEAWSARRRVDEPPLPAPIAAASSRGQASPC